MGPRLLGNLQHIAFSSDNVLIAGVCDGKCICVWNVSTRELVRSGSGIPEELQPIIWISFSTDRRTVITIHSDQSMYAWNEIGGFLVPRPAPSAVATIVNSPSLENNAELPREISGARWYPSKQGHSTLWAYLDGYVIRGCWEDRSVTVVPVAQ